MIELLPDNITRISAHMRQLGWIKQDLRSLEVAGVGNMNRTYRAIPDGGDSLILKQSLDHVARYPEIPAPIERAGVEAAFYAALAPNHELLASTPTLIGYDPANQLLAMQDLGSGADFTDLYQEGLAGDSTRQGLQHLLQWLSALHSLDAPQDFPRNDGMRVLNHEHIFDFPLTAPAHAMVSAYLGPLATVLAAEIADDNDLRQSARALGAIYLGNKAFDATPVLLHGDFYPGGWLRTYSRAYVIDPEFAFVGPAEFDVGVFTAHMVFAGLTPDEIEKLLQHYDAPPRYERRLADRFAGIELLRRLLGVAQLPLTADDAIKAEWLQLGRRLVL